MYRAERAEGQRIEQFRTLLSANFSGWHQIGTYADAFGCTQKSRTRATQEATSLRAKDYIARRLVLLAAKRLLVQTDRPIHLIAQVALTRRRISLSSFAGRPVKSRQNLAPHICLYPLPSFGEAPPCLLQFTRRNHRLAVAHYGRFVWWRHEPRPERIHLRSARAYLNPLLTDKSTLELVRERVLNA